MKSNEINALISTADIEAILSFLPRLDELIPSGIWYKEIGVSVEGNTAMIERGEYNPVILEFQQALYRHGFILDFDWPKWQAKAVRIVEDSALLQKSRMITCVKLLTLHIRKDRFCDGHLGAMIASGHIAAILRRLSILDSK